ncbi:MAG: hypothetical protein ACRDLN_04960, partial [Solirubrobacteraceae bacterium]
AADGALARADVAAGPAADAGASERALFIAIRLLIEDASDGEVEARLRDELGVEDAAPLLADARARAQRLSRRGT